MKNLMHSLFLVIALLIPTLALAQQSEAPSIVSFKSNEVYLDIQVSPLMVVIGDGQVEPVTASEIATVTFFVKPGLVKNIIQKPVRFDGRYIIVEKPSDPDYTHWNYQTKDGRWLLVDPSTGTLCNKDTAVEQVLVNGVNMGCSFAARGSDARAFRTVNYTPNGKKPDA